MPRRARPPWIECKRSGIWQIAWTEDRRKVTRSAGTRDQGEAKAFLERFLAALEQPEQPAAPTVADALEGYLIDRNGKVVDLERLELCARHLKRRLGWLTIEELRPSHSRTYAEARTRDGVGPATVRKELLTLRTALRWALGERWVDALPAVPAPGKPAPRERWLTRAEAAALEAAAVNPHIKLFVQLALGTAARSGAILGLRWPQVDLEQGVIDFGRGSGHKRRVPVPINAGLAAALTAAKAVAETAYVIEYHRQRIGSVKGAFKQTVVRAGIAHATPHDLRRTAGSWLLQAGVSIEVVSAMLGHTDYRTTQAAYAFWNVDFLRSAAALLGNEVATQPSREPAETA